jgi:hypothetical protein
MVSGTIEVGDNVIMSSFHWVFRVVEIDGDSARLLTPYLADGGWFPLNTMGKTSEPFEDRTKP